MTPLLDAADLADARRFNRWLAWAPRLGIRPRWLPRLAQRLLRLAQVLPAWRLARAGIRVQDRIAHSGDARVAVRVMLPPQAVRGIVLDIHGGGWMFGNARMNDRLNAALATACGVAVVSVDYRLAPATPLAGILDDCVTAARWLLEGGLPGLQALPVCVVGESAGAHLAAATLLRLQDWPPLLRRIEGAVLYYGVYDLAGTPSVRAAGKDTLLLDGPGLADALRALTPGMSDAERRRPPLSPLYGELADLPPALMCVGDLDPLRDDTLALAARWRGGDGVELHLLPEAPHGLVHFPTRMASRVRARSHAWIAARLARAARVPVP